MMTWYGEVLGFTRYGLMERKPSPLERATFEMPVRNLVEAALISEPSPMKSVIENILVDQPIPVGTGSVKVVFDEEKFEKLKKRKNKKNRICKNKKVR